MANVSRAPSTAEDLIETPLGVLHETEVLRTIFNGVVIYDT